MLPGVKSVTSGYAGGTKENPTYKEVCSGDTGHAEVIQIEYDPKVVSYEKLLETFWEAHDPTTLNRQGADTRHAIPLDHSLQQRGPEGGGGEVKGRGAEAFQQAHRHRDCAAARSSTRREDYHQDYYRDNPNQPYCRVVIRPKVEKFEKKLKAGRQH